MKVNGQKDQLFILIKSLTKAEKRNFKLYTNRSQGGSDTKFLQLFDALDKLQEYDEELLLKKLPAIKKRHLPNLKRHLSKQILISLRLIYIQKNIDIQIREQLDFARILYTKGMYMQSLRMLERIKKIAVEHHQDLLHLEIIEFQKLIEARHITRTRSIENKMEELLLESERRSQVTLVNSQLSNLNIKIHGYYIEHGVVKNKKDKDVVNTFFYTNLPEGLDDGQMTFFERVNLYQSYMWYYYILLDFKKCREFAGQWVNLFQVYPQMQAKDPDLYMRGIYYLLTFFYFDEETKEFEYYLKTFESFGEIDGLQLNANSKRIYFVYLHLSKLNFHLLKKEFDQGLNLASEIMEQMETYKPTTDIHRILLFYYKIAYLHFCKGDFENALDYLNEIIHLKGGALRSDLHYNSRLLHLLTHYELGNYDLAAYLIPSLKRSFNKVGEANQIQCATLDFLQAIVKVPAAESIPLLQQFQTDLEAIVQSPYEKKAIQYLDVLLWVKSKLKQFTIHQYSEQLALEQAKPYI